MDLTEFNAQNAEYPSARLHPSRVVSGRWMMFCAGLLLLLFGVGIFTSDRVNAQGQKIAIVIGSIGLVVAASAPVAPRSIVVRFSWYYTGQNAMNAVLGSECVRKPSNLLLEAGIISAVLGPLYFAMYLIFDLGKTVIGLAILIPVGCWSFSIMYRQNLRPSFRLGDELELELRSLGYLAERATPFKGVLRNSFLNIGLSLDVTDVWSRAFDGGSIFWGRYIVNDELTSGVFCAFQPAEYLPASLVGRMMASRGSVYYDEESSTLFGTLRRNVNAVLNGVPWQHFASAIICRFDSDLVEGLRYRADVGGERLEVTKLIQDWESLAVELAAEAMNELC